MIDILPERKAKVISKIGTFLLLKVDFSVFSVKNGWGNVSNFGSRVAALSAFMVVVAAIIPIWVPAQDDLTRFQLKDHADQLKVLSLLPTQVALLQQQYALMQQTIDSIVKSITTMVIGGALYIAKGIFEKFGGSITINGRKGHGS